MVTRWLIAVVFAAAWGLYNIVRITTEGSTSRATYHAERLLHLERNLGIAWERSAQEVVLARPHLVSFFNGIYTWAFWPTVVASLALLYVRDRLRYLVMRDALFVSGAIGLVIFASFPVAPPRFLDGFVDTLAEVSGVDLEHPLLVRFYNPVAAMPSLHVAFAVVTGAEIAARSDSVLVKSVAHAYPPLVATVVAGTANHYVLDAVAGAALGVAARRLS